MWIFPIAIIRKYFVRVVFVDVYFTCHLGVYNVRESKNAKCDLRWWLYHFNDCRLDDFVFTYFVSDGGRKWYGKPTLRSQSVR